MRRILLASVLFSSLLVATPIQRVAAQSLDGDEYLTGDLFGLRTGLAESGVVADLQLTQFYQSVADGGLNQTSKYGGKLDYFFTFAKGLAVLHAETRFGEDVILDAAGLAPVNSNMLYPGLENTTAITGLQFNLPLSTDQEWIATFGKINTLDLFNTIYPQTGRGVDGFMNGSAFLPSTVNRTIPMAFLGAGVMKMHQQQIEGALLVYDSHNVTTTSGFDRLFANGANIAGVWRFFSDLGGLPGSHLFLGTWATGKFTSLDPTGWVFPPGGGVIPTKSSSSWSLLYILEQKLWVDPCCAKRNIGLLSQWGLADPRNSVYAWSGNLSFQAQGLIAGREEDTMGIGCFYSGLSEDLKDLLAGIAPLDDLQGVELYYNAAITPWFHLTTDLQFVQPGISANDTAVVLGLRGKIDI